jgi:hypothetical protein
MSARKKVRIDEVAKYYAPVATVGIICSCLFWLIAAVSLFMPYSASLINITAHRAAQTIFLILVLAHFVLSQISRFYLVPRAELMRRRQLLSDAFGTPLSHDRTSLYYNNQYSPSVPRLGANTMENALFSKEIAASMLRRKRVLIGGYVVAWLLAFALRHNNLELLTWITQLVFSGEILVGWLRLEVLRFRHERTFDQLHDHFLHELGEKSPRAIASVLDAFVSYEAAKSSAGVLLSTKAFKRLNPSLTKQWAQIRIDLGMESPQC